MTKAEKKLLAQGMRELKLNKTARAEVHEYVYRQSRKMTWDTRKTCYGVGLYWWNQLYKRGYVR